MDDDNDSVVQEFDISIVTTNAQRKKADLKLFSFASSSNPFANDCLLESIQVKPKSCHFEITINFETSQIEQANDKCNELSSYIGNSTCSGRKRTRKATHDSCAQLKNRHKKFSSVKINDLQVKYAVCELNECISNLKLIPIDGVFEFKIDFTYIDQLQSNDTSEHIDSSSDIELNELRRPVVRFESVSESIRNQKKNNDKSVDRLKYANEPSVQMKLINKKLNKRYCHFGVKTKKDSACDMFASVREKTTKDPKTSSYKFANGVWTLPVSFSSINKMKVADQLKCLLINCRVLRWSEVLHLISVSCEQTYLLILIQHYANLVQGNWVAKSKLLFPHDLQRNSISLLEVNDRLAILFDCLCFCFHKQSEWKRSQLLQKVKAPFDELLHLLQLIAKFDDQSQTWTFVNEKDERFLIENEAIVAKQKHQWEMRYLHLAGDFKPIKMMDEDLKE